jgi:hypothetical protein
MKHEDREQSVHRAVQDEGEIAQDSHGAQAMHVFHGEGREHERRSDKANQVIGGRHDPGRPTNTAGAHLSKEE